MTEDTIADMVEKPGTKVAWDAACDWYIVQQTYQVDGQTFFKRRTAHWYRDPTTIPRVRRVRDGKY
jgi:hypothetical protein